MKTIILSNHNREMIDREYQRQEHTYDRSMRIYERKHAYWEHLVEGESVVYQRSVELLNESQCKMIDDWRRRGLLRQLGHTLRRCWITMVAFVGLTSVIVTPAIEELLSEAYPEGHYLRETWEWWALVAAGAVALLTLLACYFIYRPTRLTRRKIRKELGPEPTGIPKYIQMHEPRAPIKPELESDTLGRRLAGEDAEVEVHRYFDLRLNDDWTFLSGYNGPGGEVDGILVGPLGICAIEIKAHSGTIYVRGDEWKRDRYDRNGHLVEKDLPIEDNGGRAPSRQLNEAVRPLKDFLADRKQPNRVRTAVILTNRGVVIGDISLPTVDNIGAIYDLTVDDLLPQVGQRLSRAVVDSVVKNIEHSHRVENQQNPQGSSHRRSR